LATLDTNGLVASETETPDLAAARRLYNAIATQAMEDAKLGDAGAMAWLDGELPGWREHLSPEDRKAMRRQRKVKMQEMAHLERVRDFHAERLRQERRRQFVQSWLAENRDHHLAVEAVGPSFYAEIRRTVNDDGDWITRYGVRKQTLLDALASLGAKLEKEE
jgi:hypothetical protein